MALTYNPQYVFIINATDGALVKAYSHTISANVKTDWLTRNSLFGGSKSSGYRAIFSCYDDKASNFRSFSFKIKISNPSSSMSDKWEKISSDFNAKSLGMIFASNKDYYYAFAYGNWVNRTENFPMIALV